MTKIKESIPPNTELAVNKNPFENRLMVVSSSFTISTSEKPWEIVLILDTME